VVVVRNPAVKNKGRKASIGDGGLHARIRGGRGCRLHGLCSSNVLVSRFFYAPQIIAIRIQTHTRSLDVTDNRTGLVVHELDANLSDTTARAYFHTNFVNPVLTISFQFPHTSSAQNAGHLDELDGDFGGIHFVSFLGG
jgi:hypothetical protein